MTKPVKYALIAVAVYAAYKIFFPAKKMPDQSEIDYLTGKTTIPPGSTAIG